MYQHRCSIKQQCPIDILPSQLISSRDANIVDLLTTLKVIVLLGGYVAYAPPAGQLLAKHVEGDVAETVGWRNQTCLLSVSSL